ncbi:MAG: DUF4258 domain-containing protein [Formosimonas sp.]
MPHDQHLLKTIRAAAQSGAISFTVHAQRRMIQREISRSMVLEALARGKTRREPEPNLQHGSIEVELNHYSAGVNYSVVVALVDGEVLVTVITVY